MLSIFHLITFKNLLYQHTLAFDKGLGKCLPTVLTLREKAFSNPFQKLTNVDKASFELVSGKLILFLLILPVTLCLLIVLSTD